jgi:hypothetical protein
MIARLFKYEMYVEVAGGPVQWIPLIETGKAGTVVRWLWFWSAYNRV